MGSIKAYVGNLKKVEGENEIKFEGIGVYAGQEADGTFPWETEAIASTAIITTVNTAIRNAVIAGSETAGNDFSEVTDAVMIAGGPSVL